MTMNNLTTVFLFSLLSVFALVSAFPIRRDVWDPEILSPNSSTVWVIGQTYNVTWNTSDHPVNITNKIGKVVLATNYIQNYEHPLASNFSVLDGTVAITVPDVEPGSDYSIVLMGDSGNYSPNFTITSA